MPRLTSDVGAWQDALRRREDLGFASVAISEHLTGGWSMEPLTTIAAAASATSHIRFLTLVLANDFHHPVLLHKAIATLDVLSGGRVELGLGTGWLAADYEASGIEAAPIGRRIDRLDEAVRVIKGLFGPHPVTFHGDHYRVTGLVGQPAPIQQPRPPILIGGGGRRLLSLAAREADIVGVHARLAGGTLDPGAAADLDADRIGEKVGWIRAAAREAGRDPEAIELQFTVYLCRITSTPRGGLAAESSFAGLLGANPGLVRRSPAVLIGTVEAGIDRLIEHRDRYGLSYWHLGSDIEAVAPIVARLSGA